MDFDLTKESILAISRHTISILGGTLIAQGKITADELESLTGGILVLISISLSFFNKRITIRKINKFKNSVNKIK